MGYSLYPMSVKADRIIATRMNKDALPWPPKRTLDRQFPFQIMLEGEAFRLNYFENSKRIVDRCREFVQRYNRTYFVHFAVVKHDNYLEIARIV